MARKEKEKKKPAKKTEAVPVQENIPEAAEADEDQDGADAKRDRFVVFLRHGIAEPKDGKKPDEERSLTKGGHARMKEISRGLAEIFPKAEAIYSSPLLRCVQTSLWVSKGYRGRLRPQTADVLAPSGRIDELKSFLDSVEDRRIILVGHEPNLSDGVQKLLELGGRGESLELKKGGCYGVRLREDGSTALEWVLTPRVLRRLAG